MGRPRPSVSRWSLVEKPPRERPNAWSGGSADPLFASPRGGAAGADDGGVDEEDAPVDLRSVLQHGAQQLDQAHPGPIPAPSVERSSSFHCASVRSNRGVAMAPEGNHRSPSRKTDPSGPASIKCPTSWSLWASSVCEEFVRPVRQSYPVPAGGLPVAESRRVRSADRPVQSAQQPSP